MKRTIVLACVLAVLVALLALAAGCGTSSSKASGTYVLKSDPKQTITLTSDGKFTVVQGGEKITGTWKLSGNKLVLTPSSPKGLSPLTVTLSGNTIKDTANEEWVKK